MLNNEDGSRRLRVLVMRCEQDLADVAAFEDGRKRPQAKEWEQPEEARQGMASPSGASRKVHSPADTLTLA